MTRRDGYVKAAKVSPPRQPALFADVVQGSTEWENLRRGIVTASVVGKLVTAKTLKVASNDDSRGLTALLVAERITGYTDPVFVSNDMLRGQVEEPIARDAYARRTGADVTTVGFMIRDEWGFPIGYSPDGLVGDDGLIEIKSRRQKIQLRTVVNDEIPAENMAQMQCGLLVSGRQWCDYVSYCGGMPLYVKRVLPDPRWHEAIVEAVQAFEDAALQMFADYHRATKGLPATERLTDILSDRIE